MVFDRQSYFRLPYTGGPGGVPPQSLALQSSPFRIRGAHREGFILVFFQMMGQLNVGVEIITDNQVLRVQHNPIHQHQIYLQIQDLNMMKNEFYEVYTQIFEYSLTLLRRTMMIKLKAIKFSEQQLKNKGRSLKKKAQIQLVFPGQKKTINFLRLR